MFNPWGQVFLRGSVGTKFVCDDHTRVTPDFEQLPKEAHRSRLVPAGLHRNIENIPVGIDRSPEPMFATFDRYHGLVEMPFVGWARPTPADISGKLGAETRYPVPDRFVGNRDAPSRQKIFNVAKTESKPVVCPNRVADNRARETEPLETVTSDRFNMASGYNRKAAPKT